jgi:L-lysine exporter family protein LysE/ArgO
MDWAPFARGFGLGFSLIAAIGAQNAYVLTRGILRNHHWPVAAVCAFLDAMLITAGMLGMGRLVALWPGVIDALTLFGALFLFVYGLLSFRKLFRQEGLQAGGGQVSLRTAVATVVALSLLNPHVYLDTVVLIGSIGVQEPESRRPAFGFGAVTASVVWFFCLALGGQALKKWFQSANAWRLLDFLVGLIMWALAFSLIRRLL